MKLCLASLLVSAFLTGSLLAQSTGSINGRVTDSTGAAVPAATLTVTNRDTGIARSTATSAEGLYTIPALQPGNYDLKAEKAGFAAALRAATVLVGTTSTIDIALNVAQASEKVEVTSEIPIIETTQSEVSGSLQVREVQDLPMLNRNFTGLVTLVPGARPAPLLDTSKATMGAGISVGGNEGRNMGLNVDGAENRDLMLGGPAMDYSLEAIQEFKLLAHDFGAQYARSSGAVLEIATKSGANKIHGSAFGYGRTDGMTGIDYFTKQASLPKNSYDREQFGGSLGGPVVKNRWFYFGAVERIQQNFVETEPTTAYNEASILANAVPSLGIVPAKTMSKPFDGTLYTLKSDIQATPKHSLFVRWSQQKDAATNDQIGIAQTGAGTIHPDLSDPSNGRHNVWSIVASDNWVINDKSINQLLFQRNHYEYLLLQPHDNRFHNLQFPSLATGAFIDLQFFQDKYQLADNYSRQMGRHSLKIGGQYAWIPNFNIGADVLQFNYTIFTADPSTIVSDKAKYPLGFQTPGLAFLMFVGNLPGSPDGKTIPPLTQDTPIGFKDMGFYVQDDWRVTPGFTLNLGLRYDLTLNGFNQQQASQGRVYQALKAIGSPYAAKLPSTPTRDVQPRIGFAWDINGNGKNVLKVGAGLFRDAAYLADIWQTTTWMKPTLNPYITYVNLPFLPPALNPLAKYVVGVGPLPPAPPLGITQLPPGIQATADFISPRATDPYTLQYHAGYTRALTSNLVIGGDYTHINGLHEFRIHDINPVEGAWDPTDADKHIPWGTRRLASKFQSALGDGALFGGIKEITTANRSRFDELLVHMEHRGRRLTLQGSYTLAYAYAYGGITGGLATSATSPPEPMNPDQLFAPGEWGPTDSDERHRFVISGVVQLPAGIQVSPVLQAASARRYTLTTGGDTNGDGVSNRPNGDRWTDPATGQLVSVNSQSGSPTFNFDCRVTKSFAIKSESRKLDLFAEFFNITNRANFGNYYGSIVGTRSFKQAVGYLPGLPSSRQLQLGGRFTF